MIDFDFSKHCCGCAVCVDACPQRCISIIKDNKDFRIPCVDASKCVHCGLCEKVCPILNNYAPKGLEKLYCSYNYDVKQRKEGSSGSLFALLANEIISSGGAVVGAAFDKELQLKHVVAEVVDELGPLMKSKYIQSDTTGIFNKVKKILKSGSKVLFVGTPCQCQALSNFIGNSLKDNLLLVDFICHGVPSQELFNKSIQAFECNNKCKVTSFSFREKAKGVLHCYKIKYIFEGDTEEEIDIGLSKDFPFYNGYLHYNIFRENCYECSFARRERISDITLGDFWHLQNVKKGIKDFRKGYSMLIVNTDKGMDIINRISPCAYLEEFPIEVAEKCNYAYIHPTRKRILHKWFMQDYNVKPYKEIELKYLRTPVGFRQQIMIYVIDKFNL